MYTHDWLPRAPMPRTMKALSWSWSVELAVLRVLAWSIVADVTGHVRRAVRR
jgi:hypothetical protein